MNLKRTLEKKQEKQNVLRMCKYIGADPDRFSILMDLFLNGDNRTAQNASWVISHVADAHPFLINPFYNDFIVMLQKPVHNAVKRNITRIFAEREIPAKHLGILAEICFNFMVDTKEAIAVRSFSMSVLYQICLQEPGLASELKMTIETYLPTGSAGFKSRGKRILKDLKSNFNL